MCRQLDLLAKLGLYGHHGESEKSSWTVRSISPQEKGGYRLLENEPGTEPDVQIPSLDHDPVGGMMQKAVMLNAERTLRTDFLVASTSGDPKLACSRPDIARRLAAQPVATHVQATSILNARETGPVPILSQAARTGLQPPASRPLLRTDSLAPVPRFLLVCARGQRRPFSFVVAV